MRKSLCIVLILLCCLPATMAWSQTQAQTENPNQAQAQPKADKTNPEKMDPMEVSATRVEEPANSPYHLPASSAASIWAIDHDQIMALEPRDIFDVLGYAPGVQVSFQGRKGMNFVSGRGGGNFIGGTSYAFIIDGAYIPWTQSSRMMADFPVETIESIQVVRDTTTLTLAPLTTLGGIGATIQGVIIIKTRKPSKSNQSELKVGYGNLDSYKAYVNNSGKNESAYYSLNYKKNHTDGRDDWNNGSDSDVILLKGGYDKNGLTADASFYYDWASREIQRSTAVSKTYGAKWEYDPLDTLMATLNLAKQWNKSQSTSLGLYTGRINTTINYRTWVNSTYSSDDQEDNVVQADLRHIIVSGKNNFRVGAQAIWWDCPDGQLYYEGFERKEQLYSGYIYDEYSLTKAWSVDAGLRADFRHISKGINKFSPTSVTPSDIINDDWAEPSYSVAAGTAYRFNPMWEASFRMSFVQQGSDDYLFTKDGQSLDSERQMRYEAGLVARIHPALQATFTAFLYDLTDMKQVVGSVTVGEDVYNVYANADAIRDGFEVNFTGYLFTTALNYGLSYSYQRSDNDADDDAIPHHTASLRLGYRYNPFSVNLMARYVSEYNSNQFAVNNSYYEIGDFSRIDANVNYDFVVGKTQWRATIFGQNLTDEEYETRLGWKDVGLLFGVELGLKF
ncbi:MAG: TonB-dependent receptor [Deltaproteobacteria bacterium]|nr:TonB-dependent receptor [Deltaproteobacteria bacterium]